MINKEQPHHHDRSHGGFLDDNSRQPPRTGLQSGAVGAELLLLQAMRCRGLRCASRARQRLSGLLPPYGKAKGVFTAAPASSWDWCSFSAL